jgi:hypothetical protein
LVLGATADLVPFRNNCIILFNLGDIWLHVLDCKKQKTQFKLALEIRDYVEPLALFISRYLPQINENICLIKTCTKMLIAMSFTVDENQASINRRTEQINCGTVIQWNSVQQQKVMAYKTIRMNLKTIILNKRIPTPK